MTPRPETEIAREYLAQAQSLNELPEMSGHAFFILGCAVKQLIDAVEKLNGLDTAALRHMLDRIGPPGTDPDQG